jgi:hypothetical protein
MGRIEVSDRDGRAELNGLDEKKTPEILLRDRYLSVAALVGRLQSDRTKPYGSFTVIDKQHNGIKFVIKNEVSFSARCVFQINKDVL